MEDSTFKIRFFDPKNKEVAYCFPLSDDCHTAQAGVSVKKESNGSAILYVEKTTDVDGWWKCILGENNANASVEVTIENMKILQDVSKKDYHQSVDVPTAIPLFIAFLFGLSLCAVIVVLIVMCSQEQSRKPDESEQFIHGPQANQPHNVSQQVQDDQAERDMPEDAA